MPRRNHRDQTRHTRRPDWPAQVPDDPALTTEQMARRLVSRGLCSPQILEGFFPSGRSHNTQQENR